MKFYDARTGGGFPRRSPLPPCAAADECHGPSSSSRRAPSRSRRPGRTSGRAATSARPRRRKEKTGKKKQEAQEAASAQAATSVSNAGGDGRWLRHRPASSAPIVASALLALALAAAFVLIAGCAERRRPTPNINLSADPDLLDAGGRAPRHQHLHVGCDTRDNRARTRRRAPASARTRKDIIIHMPPGFIGNPNAMPRCDAADFALNQTARRTRRSAVFTARTRPAASTTANQNPTALMRRSTTCRRIHSQAGPARLHRSRSSSSPSTSVLNARTESDYGLDAATDTPSRLIPVADAQPDLWGVPASPTTTTPGSPAAGQRTASGRRGTRRKTRLPTCHPPTPSSAPQVPFLQQPDDLRRRRSTAGLDVTSLRQQRHAMPTRPWPATTGLRPAQLQPQPQRPADDRRDRHRVRARRRPRRSRSRSARPSPRRRRSGRPR